MKALWYIKKRSFINKAKRRLKKPVTYVWGALILAYIIFMIVSFSVSFKQWGLGSPEGFVVILSAFTLITMPTNFKAYAKRKGLVFLPADVHMVFPGPTDPKSLLIYGMGKLMISSWVMALIMAIGGIWWFHLSVAQVILYLIGGIVIDTLFEGSLVILVYGNDDLPDWVQKIVTVAIYGMIALVVILAGYLFFMVDHSFGAVGKMLNHPLLQCIPVLGWNIAMIRLILLGPTALNVVCTVLYLVTTAVMVIAAVRMPCHGEYYEDAMTFAEDYQVALAKSKEGKVAIVGKKTKYKKAGIVYKGTGAKAIYYRQLLEYKKKRFFIFGWNSFLSFGIGIVLAVIGALGYMDSEAAPIAVPCIMLYIVMIFSGYVTKWEVELKNVYTFLLPDNPFRKMWYATKVEHIRNLIDGALIVVPCFLFLELSVVEALLLILLYMCMKGANLYAHMVCQGILGRLLGQFGMSMVQMLIFMLIMGIGALFGVVAGLAFGVGVGYLAMTFYGTLLTGGLAIASAGMFARMEMLE
ncbi:MAG: putative ABC exporter domain-containing protein [Lachnospiraceae bacterium]|nr:putative ABC exporter domain-containing protein [Lachnospiraceae bacterium]